MHTDFSYTLRKKHGSDGLPAATFVYVHSYFCLVTMQLRPCAKTHMGAVQTLEQQGL